MEDRKLVPAAEIKERPKCKVSQVTLTIRKHGEDATKQLVLVREKINFNPVSSQLCGSASAAGGSAGKVASSSGSGRVGYIRVATFSKQTAENARSAIQKLKSEGADRCGMKWALLPFTVYPMHPSTASCTVLTGTCVFLRVIDQPSLKPFTGCTVLCGQTGMLLIGVCSLADACSWPTHFCDDLLCVRRFVLDVRNNGGGLFPAGVDVARMWLDAGEIVLIADSQGVRDSYEAEGSALDATSPLSVLVNRGTASASEVSPVTVQWMSPAGDDVAVCV